MDIRFAAAGDARGIAEIHVAAWHAAYRGLIPEEQLAVFTVEKRMEFWPRAIAEPRSSQTFVAEVDGALAGFCLLAPTRDDDGKGKAIGEIIALYVRPELWRGGIGRALCDVALGEAARREWRTVTLWVVKGNEDACRFYEALGFRLDGTEKTDRNMLRVPIPELRYAKALPGS